MSAWTRIKSWFAGTRSPGGVGVISTWSLFGGESPRRGTRELFQLYRCSPWLFCVENRLANERATCCRWKLYDAHEDDPDRVELGRKDQRYKVLRLLRAPTRCANGQILSARQRNKLLALWLGLAGEAYLYKQRNAAGVPVGLVPISPLWVSKVPTVAAPWYEIQVDPSLKPQVEKPENIIPLVDLDPENPYGRGVGVAQTLTDEIETDEGSAAVAKSEVLNRGIPAGIVVVKGAPAAGIVQLKSRWGSNFSGPENAGKVEFLGADDVKLLEFGNKLIFKDSVEQRRFLRDMFVQVHGLSPEVFGILDGSTRDSAYVAYYHLALGSLVPWLGISSDAYQSHLLPDFDPTGQAHIGYVSPVPEDRELKLRCIATGPSVFRGKDLRGIGGFVPDKELDEQIVASATASATPSQLKQAMALDRSSTRDLERVFNRVHDLEPAWARAMSRTKGENP